MVSSDRKRKTGPIGIATENQPFDRGDRSSCCGRLTRNLMAWTRLEDDFSLYDPVVFRFHVNFPGIVFLDLTV